MTTIAVSHDAPFIAVQDNDCRILLVNTALAAALGVPLMDILGRTCHELLFDCATPCRDCIRPGAPDDSSPRSRICHATTLGVVLKESALPMQDAAGQTIGYALIAHSIRAQDTAPCRQ